MCAAAQFRFLGVLTACCSLYRAQLPLRHYTIADGLANNAVYGIASDSRGFLWFATAEGLSHFDGFGFANETRNTGLPHSTFRQVLIGRHGNYWLATPEGLIRFRPVPAAQHGSNRCHPAEGRTPEATTVLSLLEDHNGRLWCGTGAGLYAIDDTASPSPRITEVPIGLPELSWGDSEVTGLAEDAEGGVWIGGSNGTLYHRRPDQGIERYATRYPLPQSQITHLLVDRKGRIWVGRANSLYRSIPAPHPGANGFERLSGHDGGPPNLRVFDIFESRDGDIWVAMYRYLAQFPAEGPASVCGARTTDCRAGEWLHWLRIGTATFGWGPPTRVSINWQQAAP